MPNIHDSSSDSLARSSSATSDDAWTEAAGDEMAGPAITDPLSDALRAVRLTGALFFLWDVAWPYVTTVPDGGLLAPLVLPGAQQVVSYHVVVEGSAWGGVPGQAPTRFEQGDILLVPHGDAYVMSNSSHECVAATVQVEEALEFFTQMGTGQLPFLVKDGPDGGASTRVVCGFLGCDQWPFNPVFGSLPAVLRLPRCDDPSRDRVLPLLEIALAESRRPQPGSHAMLLRLSEMLFVEVVRRCLTALPAGEKSWLQAVGDPIVGPALMYLHRRPEGAWTLDSLAASVGISRSRLVERFTESVGQPPMQYLTKWRIQLATRLLSDGAEKVAAVAEQVGYGSEAAFSRAFKRCVGVSPAEFRRRVVAARKAGRRRHHAG